MNHLHQNEAQYTQHIKTVEMTLTVVILLQKVKTFHANANSGNYYIELAI